MTLETGYGSFNSDYCNFSDNNPIVWVKFGHVVAFSSWGTIYLNSIETNEWVTLLTDLPDSYNRQITGTIASTSGISNGEYNMAIDGSSLEFRKTTSSTSSFTGYIGGIYLAL